VHELADTALRWAADVFAIAGAPTPPPSPDPDPGQPTGGHAALRARFGPQIERIARVALRLVRVAREEIMSTAFDAAAVAPGRAFAPAEMSDAFADTVRAQAAGAWAPAAGERVLCTTEVGLVCATRVEERGEVQRVVLLKPKVVLESVTRVLEER
jgi:hypothetical protein